MSSLNIKINEMKNNLIKENIKAIEKEKSKLIKNNNKKNKHEEEFLIEEYNYYLKLIKKINKYIRLNENTNIILKKKTDLENNIVYIVISIQNNKLDIGIPIDIRLLTGNKSEAYMECIYYESKDSGVLYINNFRSIVPKKGYGGILLKELDEIVEYINSKLKKENMKSISMIKGNLVADKNIINEKILRQIYKLYNFEIDHENRILRKI